MRPSGHSDVKLHRKSAIKSRTYSSYKASHNKYLVSQTRLLWKNNHYCIFSDNSTLSEFDPLGDTAGVEEEEEEKDRSLIDWSNRSTFRPSPSRTLPGRPADVVFLLSQDIVNSEVFRFRRTFCVSLFRLEWADIELDWFSFSTIYHCRYSAAVVDEISLQPGDILQILGFLEPGWLVATLIMRSDGEMVRARRGLGVIPANYVRCFQITRHAE